MALFGLSGVMVLMGWCCLGARMSETKFTPAPWVAIYPESRHMYNGSDLSTYEICTEKTRSELKAVGFTHYREDRHSVDNITIAQAYWRDMSDEEAKANANLIACAPEMYAMLELIASAQKKHYGDGMGLHIAMITIAKEIEALLAKARGEA
jgi:hypothetical protein